MQIQTLSAIGVWEGRRAGTCPRQTAHFQGCSQELVGPLGNSQLLLMMMMMI